MAIDMIEDSELSALAPSRLGNKCFIDDSHYSNLLGLFGSGGSIRGHKYHDRKRAEAESRNINSESVDPVREKDCDYLTQLLAETQNRIQVELGSNPSKARVSNVVGALRQKEANLKNLVAKNKCEDKALSEQSRRAKEETIAEINKASADSPDLAKASELATQGGGVSKYLLWGVGGIVGIVTLIIVFKAIKKK
jgi:hypothetical protein